MFKIIMKFGEVVRGWQLHDTCQWRIFDQYIGGVKIDISFFQKCQIGLLIFLVPIWFQFFKNWYNLILFVKYFEAE